jgi:hypothetical protein
MGVRRKISGELVPRPVYLMSALLGIGLFLFVAGLFRL